MSRKAVALIIIACAVAALCLTGVVLGGLYVLGQFGADTNAADNADPQKQQEMLALTLEWGRLAPLPDSIEQFQISIEGGPSTRSFRSSFYANEEDLTAWIASSPGLQDARVTEISDGAMKYTISPGGGAAYAEAVIDPAQGFVQLYVYWS